MWKLVIDGQEIDQLITYNNAILWKRALLGSFPQAVIKIRYFYMDPYQVRKEQ